MSEGFGMYTRGLRLEYRASQIRQVPSSDDLQIFIFIFIFTSKDFIEKENVLTHRMCAVPF